MNTDLSRPPALRRIEIEAARGSERAWYLLVLLEAGDKRSWTAKIWSPDGKVLGEQHACASWFAFSAPTEAEARDRGLETLRAALAADGWTLTGQERPAPPEEMDRAFQEAMRSFLEGLNRLGTK